MNPTCLEGASKVSQASPSHGTRRVSEKPKLQGKGSPFSAGCGPSRRENAVAASPLRNSFVPEPGSLGETFVFSRSSYASGFYGLHLYAGTVEESEPKPEPQVAAETHEAQSVAEVRALKPVTLNLRQTEPASPNTQGGMHRFEASTAHTRARHSSRASATAKDPISNGQETSRKKRTARDFIQSKAFREGQSPRKSARAEPVLSPTLAVSSHPRMDSDGPIEKDGESSEQGKTKKSTIKDALADFHAAAHLLSQASEALSPEQPSSFSQEAHTILLGRMEHSLKVVDSRLVLLQWACTQAPVHTRKELMSYTYEAQSLSKAREVMSGTLAMLDRKWKQL